MTVTVTEFKAKCLKMLSDLQTTGEVIQVTKHGVVIANVIPPPVEPEMKVKAGFAKGWFEITGDIMEPIDVEWEALK